MSLPIKVGIIGPGWVATARHIPVYKRDKRAEIIAVFDRDHSKAQSAAKDTGIHSAFDNLEDFLQQPLDTISICTPPWVHASMIKAAINAGIHVLVEKPMTMTAEEGRSLEKLASEKRVILCPAHSFLFSRSVRRADKLLRDGKVGDVQWAMGIQISSSRRRLPTWINDIPGGLFFDESPHLLYLMRHFLGDLEIQHAWHTIDPNNSSSETDRVEARLLGRHGSAYLTMWSGAPFSEWLFVLFCTQGVLVLDLFRDVLLHLPPEKGHNARDVLKQSMIGTIGLWHGIGASGAQAVRKQFLFGHDLLIQQFLDAVINGKESPVSARDGWRVVAHIEDILQYRDRPIT